MMLEREGRKIGGEIELEMHVSYKCTSLQQKDIVGNGGT